MVKYIDLKESYPFPLNANQTTKLKESQLKYVLRGVAFLITGLKEDIYLGITKIIKKWGEE